MVRIDCIHDPLLGGYLAVHDQARFEIRWDGSDGDVELVGPGVRPVRFDTVGEAYRHWKRCFAPLRAAPLVVHAKAAGHDGRTLVMV